MTFATEKPHKLCFVTIGATASFDALIRTCLAPAFLATLAELGYTDLLLQYGKTGERILDELCPPKQPATAESESGGLRNVGGVEIAGFDFSAEGLAVPMRAAKGLEGGQQSVEGVVVSHAGSGSILDALRIDAALVVVPNPTLLNNHQDELAVELARQGYVVHGRLDVPGDLADAVRRAETLKTRRKEWPPVNSAETKNGRRKAKNIHTVMDEEAGFMTLG